jgi:hypothetical protein
VWEWNSKEDHKNNIVPSTMNLDTIKVFSVLGFFNFNFNSLQHKDHLAMAWACIHDYVGLESCPLPSTVEYFHISQWNWMTRNCGRGLLCLDTEYWYQTQKSIDERERERERGREGGRGRERGHQRILGIW